MITQKKLRNACVGLMAISAPLFCAEAANATVYLDQVNNALTPLNQFEPLPVNNADLFGQSFTVGRAGTLDSIRVPVFNFGAPDFDLAFYLSPIKNSGISLHSKVYSVAFSSTDILALGASQNISDVSGWLKVDFSSFNIAVQPGDRYGLVFGGNTPFVTPGPDGTVSWLLSLDNFGSENLLEFGLGLQDYSYQGGFSPFHSAGIATYISGVPEPDTWVMMIVGFGGIGFLLRGRSRNSLAQAA
ncbi:MAG: PEPxxWA-CTERM sorting domain-containing protein [Pseudomonadota bacterium]